mmetsp:Transcript_2605/g.7583  ORF Transcript_2605/g.7583 Transcript_2605/m.7583 type:complete len:283 (-) Transcript_2605:41-889(-)
MRLIVVGLIAATATTLRLAAAATTPSSTLRATCSLEAFDAAVEVLSAPAGRLVPSLAAPIKRAARSFYEGLGDPPCPVEWDATSPEPIVVNLGEGSTGTRWLARAVRLLGLRRGFHNDFICHDTPGSRRPRRRCDGRTFDAYDFATDDPVPLLAWTFMKTRPAGLFLLSVRDPRGWVRSRLAHGRKIAVRRVATPCALPGPTVGDEGAVAAYLAYNAWALCAAPKDRLLAFSVFTEIDGDLWRRLDAFLRRHGVNTTRHETVPAIHRKKRRRANGTDAQGGN